NFVSGQARSPAVGAGPQGISVGSSESIFFLDLKLFEILLDSSVF
ncbi:unnamed protein product, partial [Cercopithifilaria johnstoni]